MGRRADASGCRPMRDDSPLVLVVDDDAQIRASLDALCRSEDLNVETFASIEEFLGRVEPDVATCLVLDVRFRGSSWSGLELQRHLAAVGRSVPIVFMTGHGDVPMAVQAMKCGAVDFLLKPFREQDLLDAVRIGLARDRQWRQEQRTLDRLRAQLGTLTIRERQIMDLVTQGCPNKQIAARLGLSEVTVKVHRGHMMQKMEVRSLAELVRLNDRVTARNNAIGAIDTKALSD
jgi:FixJ family two-component response regulator